MAQSSPRTRLIPQDWSPRNADPAAKHNFETLPNTILSDSRRTIGVPRPPPGRPPPDVPGEDRQRAEITQALGDLNQRLLTVERLLSAQAFSAAAEFRLKSDYVVAGHVDVLIDAFGGICSNLERLRLGEAYEEVEVVEQEDVETRLDRSRVERMVGELIWDFRRVRSGVRVVGLFGEMVEKARLVLRALEEIKKRIQRVLVDEDDLLEEVEEEEEEEEEGDDDTEGVACDKMGEVDGNDETFVGVIGETGTKMEADSSVEDRAVREVAVNKIKAESDEGSDATETQEMQGRQRKRVRNRARHTRAVVR